MHAGFLFGPTRDAKFDRWMQTDPEFATSFGAAAAKMGAGASVPEVPDVPEEPSLVMEADESPFSINVRGYSPPFLPVF